MSPVVTEVGLGGRGGLLFVGLGVLDPPGFRVFVGGVDGLVGGFGRSVPGQTDA